MNRPGRSEAGIEVVLEAATFRGGSVDAVRALCFIRYCYRCMMQDEYTHFELTFERSRVVQTGLLCNLLS